jgi:hypothetical protein
MVEYPVGGGCAMKTDNGLPHWFSTAMCARLKRYSPEHRADMIALLVECRAKWDRDIERAAQRRVEATECENEEEAES